MNTGKSYLLKKLPIRSENKSSMKKKTLNPKAIKTDVKKKKVKKSGFITTEEKNRCAEEAESKFKKNSEIALQKEKEWNNKKGEVERIREKKSEERNLLEWVKLLEDEMLPLFGLIRKARSYTDEQASRYFQILSNILMSELQERERGNPSFAEMGAAENIFKEYKRLSDARVQAKRRIIKNTRVGRPVRSNSTIYQESCNLAILDALWNHASGNERGEFIDWKLPQKDNGLEKSENLKTWKVWLRNYLTELHKKKMLRLPSGTIFAESGMQDERLKDREKYINSIIQKPLFTIAMNIVFLLHADTGPMIGFRVTKEHDRWPE